MWHQKAKGPPDGPPIFLIFVEKLNCPQSQAYQSISPVGTGLSLTDRALGVSLGTSIGNYSPLIAPQPVKLKIKCRKACRFESGHRHHGVGAKSAPFKIRQLILSCRIFSSALPCSSFSTAARCAGFTVWRFCFCAPLRFLRSIVEPERYLMISNLIHSENERFYNGG